MTSTIPVAEIQEQRMATERPSAAVQGGHETGELDSDLYVLALNRSMPPLSWSSAHGFADVGDTTSLAAAGPPQTGVSATLQPHATQKKKQVCRFHNSKKG